MLLEQKIYAFAVKRRVLVTKFAVSILLFLIGVSGILLKRNNILIILMCIELMLLSVNINFILFSLYLDDMVGQIWSILILTVAAAEAAVGLAVLIVYYRQRGSVSLDIKTPLRY